MSDHTTFYNLFSYLSPIFLSHSDFIKFKPVTGTLEAANLHPFSSFYSYFHFYSMSWSTVLLYYWNTTKKKNPLKPVGLAEREILDAWESLHVFLTNYHGANHQWRNQSLQNSRFLVRWKAIKLFTTKKQTNNLISGEDFCSNASSLFTKVILELYDSSIGHDGDRDHDRRSFVIQF